MKFDFDKEYLSAWKALGFYYVFDDEQKSWILTGSKNGLLNFCKLLDEYASDSAHEAISEHEHYGPDSYLKVITWYSPIIKASGIYGSRKDIKRLADLLNRALVKNESNEIKIDKEYSRENESQLLLRIMPEGFDPSTLYKTS